MWKKALKGELQGHPTFIWDVLLSSAPPPHVLLGYVTGTPTLSDVYLADRDLNPDNDPADGEILPHQNIINNTKIFLSFLLGTAACMQAYNSATQFPKTRST